jgi:hypothetical protein
MAVLEARMPDVWVYQGKELKVFASAAAQKWLDENDPGGVAFKCDLEGEEALEKIPSIASGF